MGFWASLDPTSKKSIFRKGLRELDPTSSKAALGGAVRSAIGIIPGGSAIMGAVDTANKFRPKSGATSTAKKNPVPTQYVPPASGPIGQPFKSFGLSPLLIAAAAIGALLVFKKR